MPKLEKASLKYIVSFNCSFGGYDCGEEDLYSQDYHGDDIEALSEEVIADDPNFPMTFKQNNNPNSSIVGMFYGEGDDYPTALMVLTSQF